MLVCVMFMTLFSVVSEYQSRVEQICLIILAIRRKDKNWEQINFCASK